jgi:hypothetical protein
MVGRKTTAGLLCVLAIAVGLSACGGSSSSGVTPAAYVKSICQAIGPFEQSVQSRSSALKNLTGVKSPAQGKQLLQNFLNAVASDTDKALTKLKAAGTPDVNNGKQVSQAVVSAFTQLKSALQKAASSAGSLPTTSPEAFRAAAVQLGSSVQTSMTGIGSSLSNLKSSDLESAAKKEPACQNLSSGA